MKEQMVEYPVSSSVTWEETQNVARRNKSAQESENGNNNKCR